MIYTAINKDTYVPEQQVKIIPLGGLEQIGMNITCFEYKDAIIVVDCGLAFPSDDMLGVDLVVPDITYLKQNRQKVKAFFITHGHEDHIGAIPYIMKELNVPIFATRLTMAIIESKLEEHELLNEVERHIVEYGDVVPMGKFSVEFIRVNHSISDAAALAITTPVGLILHTGDFKVDYTPLCGDRADLQRLGELGNQGVIALLSDSTNAMRQGFTPTEKNVAATFDSIFTDYAKNRILVATFASNVNRVQLVIDSAVRFGRKIAIEGRSMIKIIDIARKLKYINLPDNVLVDMAEISDYADDKVCILMTGSQGEAMAALSRVSNGQHKKINITTNDVVIFSSSPIPGNEKSISKLVNELSRRGAKIINKATHVSGHACEEELKLIYALTRPKYAVPVHGEYCHRKANAELAKDMTVPEENIFMLNSGDVLTISKRSASVTGSVPHGGIMVDGLGVGDVGNIVLRDRQSLSKDGIIIIGITLSADGRLLSGPEMVSRGFVYVRESETLLDEARQVVLDAILDNTGDHYTDWGTIKTEVKNAISSYLWKVVKRNPVILPLIMEVDE